MLRSYMLAAAILLSPLAVQALEVDKAYVRGLPPGQSNTAAFFDIHNPTGKAITLQAGASDAAARLEIHAHQHRDGMMAMRRQDSVEVPAGGRLRFVPGGLHLMLIDLQRPLADGDEVRFSLLTEDGQRIEVLAPVVSVLKMQHSKHQHNGEH